MTPNSRSYLNRWAQPDSIVPLAAQGVHAWDRYAYCNNNPVRFNDPSGHIGKDNTNLPDAESVYEIVPSIFYRLPIDVEQLVGVQWFGATKRAYELDKNFPDGIYSYCQDIHCGLDLLATYGTPVYAGVYGTVIYSWTPKTQPSAYEGPYKVQVRLENGDVITYGHLNGSVVLKPGTRVNPGTIVGGVGNMGGRINSGEIDHVHLEIRKGGWSGDSQNPLNYMDNVARVALMNVARDQQIEVDMGRFYDGNNKYIYTSSSKLNPNSIYRTTSRNFWRD